MLYTEQYDNVQLERTAWADSVYVIIVINVSFFYICLLLCALLANYNDVCTCIQTCSIIWRKKNPSPLCMGPHYNFFPWAIEMKYYGVMEAENWEYEIVFVCFAWTNIWTLGNGPSLGKNSDIRRKIFVLNIYLYVHCSLEGSIFIWDQFCSVGVCVYVCVCVWGGGGGGGDISCLNMFSSACLKIKWFCQNITCFFLENGNVKNSGGGGEELQPPSPPPPPPRLVHLWKDLIYPYPNIGIAKTSFWAGVSRKCLYMYKLCTWKAMPLHRVEGTYM